MANDWKYPLGFTLIALSITVLLLLLKYFTGFELAFELPDWVKPIVIVPIVVAIFSTSLADFLPKKIIRRLKWAHAQPGMSQLYYFTAFQLALIICSALANKLTGGSIYGLTIFELAVDVLAFTVLAVYIVKLLAILRND